MADTHIDYNEVIEYGEHSIRELKKLAGLSQLVNVEFLIDLLKEVLIRFQEKRMQTTITQSRLRADRVDTEAAAAKMRDRITRFYSYLNSLDPEEVSFDLQAFFPGGNLGQLAALKPADVLAKADEVLRGFQAEENQSFPDRDNRLAKLLEAREALALALGEKEGKRGDAILDTSALNAAYEEFISLYSGTAKPVIRGLLNLLKRSDQLRLFFKDLQVNEGASAGQSEPQPPEPTQDTAPADLASPPASPSAPLPASAPSDQDAPPVVVPSQPSTSEPGSTGEPAT